jgi:hypothetical protein
MKFKALSNKERKLNLNWTAINAYTSKWKPDTPFEIEITKRQPKKSDPLRKYYFSAVLPPIMEQAGWEKDEKEELHRWLKIQYFGVKPDKFGIHRDKDIPSVFSNESELEVPKKKEFIDYVIRRAAKVGLYISDPGG